MTEDTAPATLYIDRPALPKKPGGEHRPKDANNGSEERSNPTWLSESRSLVGVGASRMPRGRRMPEKAKAWGSTQDMLTSGRYLER